MIDLIYIEVSRIIKSIRVLVVKLTTYNSQFTTQKGFTIIELLVVLTLIGLVSGIGILSLVNYGKTQTMNEAVQSIQTLIDEAKFNAISSVKPEKSISGVTINCNNNFIGYQIVVENTLNEDTVTLLINCQSQSTPIKTYTLPPELEFDVLLTTCTEIHYQVVSPAVGGTTLPCKIVINGDDNVRKTINIDLLGNATVE